MTGADALDDAKAKVRGQALPLVFRVTV